MPSGTIWPEFLPKLPPLAPPRGARGSPRGTDRAPLASFGKNSGQMVPDGIIMVPDGIIMVPDGTLFLFFFLLRNSRWPRLQPRLEDAQRESGVIHPRLFPGSPIVDQWSSYD